MNPANPPDASYAKAATGLRGRGHVVSASRETTLTPGVLAARDVW